jgi:apolipoprotein N-acyltransferase
MTSSKPISLARANILYAVLSGLLLTASFPPGKTAWVAWFALVPLLKSIGRASLYQTFKLGLIAGFTHYLTLVYWVVFVMGHYGNLHWTVALSILALLALYLGCYPACFCVVLSLLRGSRFPALKAAALWVGLECVRSFLLTGFPWCLLGYSQFQRIEVIQIADLAGVYGVSFLIVLANALIYALLLDRSFSKAGSLKWESALGLLIIAASLAYGFDRLSHRKGGDSIEVAIIQGNIEQSIKWDPKYQEETVRIYRRLTLAASHQKPGLIVWPETSVPFFFQDDGKLGHEVLRIPREISAYLLFGGPAYKREKERTRFYNRAYLLSPGSPSVDYFDKVHLVPFGEYVPLQRFLPFVKRLVVSAGDFASGEKVGPIGPPELSLGVLICYESIFPEIARAHAKKGARILANLTNDAWFGMTSAPYQHFSMAVFRAVENRKPLIRAANTGISGFISDRGEILQEGGLFSEEILVMSLPVEASSPTIYTRYGDVFAFGLLILSLIIFVHALWYRSK